MINFIRKQLIKFIDFLIKKYDINEKEILEKFNKARTVSNGINNNSKQI